MSEVNSSTKIRLNKLIADCGLASRRHADKMIEEGLVTVNGKKVYELGIKVDADADRIMVDGKPLRKPLAQKFYLIFNKPKGVLTTMDDPLDRPTVAEYLAGVPVRVFPVGRLDWDSEGLLLLTNDGDYANRVANPKEEVTKTYLVKLNGQPQPQHIEKLKAGVPIIGGRVKARHIEPIHKAGDKKSEKNVWYKVVITEGKNRQLRQMFAKVGLDVIKLQRVAIGRLRLGALKTGEVAYLNDAAAERVFLADDPDEVKTKRTYKGRAGEAAEAKKAAGTTPKRKATGSRKVQAYKAKTSLNNRPKPAKKSR